MDFEYLEDVVENQGHVSVEMDPLGINMTACAADDGGQLAWINLRKGEGLLDVLDRLNTAVGLALNEGIFTDEFNGPSST